jgi:hypothetical protein
MRCPSGYPSENDTAALLVAIAGWPTSSRIRALTTSQAFGSAKIRRP